MPERYVPRPTSGLGSDALSHARARRWAWPLLVALVVLATREARADPQAIARVRSSNPAFDKRLDAELGALGFAVKAVDADDPASDLAAVANANGAVAAIRVNASNALELWVEPLHPGDHSTRETVRIDAGRGWDVAAIAALEGLRAHLLEVRRDSATPPVLLPAVAPEPIPVSPPPPPPTDRRPWLWFHLAAAVDASPGGLAPAFDGLLEVRIEPRPWLSAAVFGAGTPLATTLAGPEGEALVRHAIAGAVVDLQKQLAPFTLALGAGGAFVAFAVDGRAPAAGYGTRDASADCVALLLRASASREVVSTLRVRIELFAGTTFPLATISFAAREEATWGRPFGLLTLGLEWGAIR